MARIEQGLAAEGAFYLFALRLAPVVPFFVVNLAFGLTRIRLLTFAWVSQLGMLPGTAIYVLAGRELGEVTSLKGIFSPGVLVALALLGLFPLAARMLLGYARRRQGKDPLPPART
jgi:uncharacterized membrane protein YdjX (TVP38/TMEM64 family)